MKILDGKYDLRPFRPGDEEGILKLWEVAFKAQMPIEKFKWKYIDNPYDETMMLCVAEDGEIVTFYGGVPYRFQYKDRVAHGVQLMDIMSHPDHRKHRVFAKTANQFISYFCTPERLLYMYGFPGEFHYSIGERILGYRKVNPAAYLKTDLNTLSAGNYVKQENRKITLERVYALDVKDSEWRKLWNDCSKDYPFSIVREPDFVKWRFLEHPKNEYHILKFIDDTNGYLIGYGVLSLKPGQAVLVDLLVKNSLSVFQDAMICISEYLLDNGVENLETWLPDNHFTADYARKTGFVQLKEPLGIIPTVALFKQSPSLDWVTSNLYYTMADADLF